jgi:methylated-DNA-[protein]-cysteine S-methyltransferase
MVGESVERLVFRSAWGWVGLAATARGLRRVVLPSATKASAEAPLRPAAPGAAGTGAAEVLTRVRRGVEAYLAGRQVDWTALPLDLSELTPFRRSVLEALRRVGYGERISYGQLAAAIGRPHAARAVGGACAHNPLPLVVPCHRVVGAGGRLGGFSAPGGLALKRRMLALESGARRA